MKLFDKLESTMLRHADQHNDLTSNAGKHIDEVHDKLRELQCKIDDLGRKPTQIEAVSKDPIEDVDPARVHADQFMYLTRPHVEIEPNGKMRILFKSDWNSMDQTHFLKDIRVRALRKIK